MADFVNANLDRAIRAENAQNGAETADETGYQKTANREV